MEIEPSPPKPAKPAQLLTREEMRKLFPVYTA